MYLFVAANIIDILSIMSERETNPMEDSSKIVYPNFNVDHH
jgi:hypothetical protein